MPRGRQSPSSPVEAVQQVFQALEPFDEQARRRIVESAASLLGMRLAPASPEAEPRTAPSIAVASPAATASATPGRPLSPVELIQQKEPTTNAQKIALFAYYREKVEGLARFSRSDLEGYFAKARQPPPGNYGRDFQAAVNLGWIHEDGAESYLTTKGLEAVEAGFGGKAQPRGRAVARSKGGGANRRAKGAKRKTKRS